MHFVYILRSDSANRFYIGETEDVNLRVSIHNTGSFKNSSTKIANDWQLVKQIEVKDRVAARIIERYLKSMKSSIFLLKLVHDEVFYENFKLIVMSKFNIEIF
jgi:putative endonuclease